MGVPCLFEILTGMQVNLILKERKCVLWESLRLKEGIHVFIHPHKKQQLQWIPLFFSINLFFTTHLQGETNFEDSVFKFTDSSLDFVQGHDLENEEIIVVNETGNINKEITGVQIESDIESTILSKENQPSIT